MSRTWKTATLACLAVLIASGGLVWYRYHHGQVPRHIALDLRRLVQRDPRLEPLLEEAMSDGVLSMVEVEAIVDSAESATDETD